MSILTQTPVNTPTREQILNSIATKIKRLASTSFDELVKIQKEGIDLVWHNKTFTPQEIFDAVGSDAVQLLEFHSGLTQYLVTVSTLDGVEFTPALPTHAFSIIDGKVVVLPTLYTP